MGCITIIVPDVNDKIEEYLQQNQGINNVFDTNIFGNPDNYNFSAKKLKIFFQIK